MGEARLARFRGINEDEVRDKPEVGGLAFISPQDPDIIEAASWAKLVACPSGRRAVRALRILVEAVR